MAIEFDTDGVESVPTPAPVTLDLEARHGVAEIQIPPPVTVGELQWDKPTIFQRLWFEAGRFVDKTVKMTTFAYWVLRFAWAVIEAWDRIRSREKKVS